MISAPRTRAVSGAAFKPAPQRALLHRQRPRFTVAKALDIDWADPDTWLGIGAAVAGLGLGIGAPIFYNARVADDEKSLDELRKLNRETFKETGKYLTDVRLSFQSFCI